MKVAEKVQHCLLLEYSDNYITQPNLNLYADLPYPIHSPFKNSPLPSNDRVKAFHENLSRYNDKLSVAKRELAPIEGELLDQDFRDSHAIITQGLLDFYNEEPIKAPYKCDYNPFYATGLLEHFAVCGTNYLIRPDIDNNLYATEINNPSNTMQIELGFKLKETILGIDCSSAGDFDVILTLRHQDQVTLLKLNDVYEMAQVKFQRKYKKSLLDAKFNCSDLGVVFEDLNFKFFNVESGKETNFDKTGKGEIIKFDFIDQTTLGMLGLDSLKIVDSRSFDSSTFSPNLDECNNLTAFKFVDNSIYLASRHFLLFTDVRNLSQFEYCSHLLKSSPCYLDLSKDKSFVCLSNQKHEKVIFGGNPPGTLPFSVPTIQDTLLKCHLSKDILLKSHINERLLKSTVGMKLATNNGGNFIYTANCLGDIFTQKLSNFECNNEYPVDILFDWINRTEEPPKRLVATNVANLSSARFALNKPILEENLNKYGSNIKKKKMFLHTFKREYHSRNLGELAKNFASIWKDDDGEDEIEDVDDIVPEVEPYEKVSKWIESSYFE